MLTPPLWAYRVCVAWLSRGPPSLAYSLYSRWSKRSRRPCPSCHGGVPWTEILYPGTTRIDGTRHDAVFEGAIAGWMTALGTFKTCRPVPDVYERLKRDVFDVYRRPKAARVY